MRETLTNTSTPAPAPITSNSGAPDYNLRVGPVKFSADVVGGIEYIDNISYSQVNRESDEVVRLGLNILTVVPLTRLNTLRFDIGVGFVRYIEHPNATSGDVFITPGSQLSLDSYIGDYVKLNFHDAFDIRQDPVDSAELSNVTNFGRFTNTGGVTATVDLHDGLVFTAEYDHFNYVALNDTFDYLDRNADQFAGSVSYQIRPRVFVGVDGGYSITNYTNDGLNNSTGGTVGGFLDATITPYLRVVLHGGYQFASFDQGGNVDQGVYNPGDTVDGLPANGTFGDRYSLSTFYYSVTLNNRLNAYLTHSLSLGREADLGLVSNYVKVDYIRYNIAWRALSNLTIGADGTSRRAGRSTSASPATAATSAGATRSTATSRWRGTTRTSRRTRTPTCATITRTALGWTWTTTSDGEHHRQRVGTRLRRVPSLAWMTLTVRESVIHLPGTPWPTHGVRRRVSRCLTSESVTRQPARRGAASPVR